MWRIRCPIPCGGTTGSAAPYATSAPAGAAAAAAARVSSPFIPARRVIFTGRILRFSTGPGLHFGGRGGRCAAPRAGGGRHVMRELEQLSHEIMGAIRTRDRLTLEAVLVADFVQIDERGNRLGKEPFIAAVEAGEFQIEELRFESLSVE